MNQPDKKPNTDDAVVPKEGQRRFLSGDNCITRCPFLGSEDLSDSQLDVLADIIFEQFLLAHNKQDTS